MVDKKWFAIFSRLHTSAFDCAKTMTLFKELVRLVTGRGGSDDGEEGICGDKVNLVIEGGDNR
jgi:hypothetical protein